MTDTEFDWGDLGEDWWRSNGEATRASEQQIKFACARHTGANRTEAARQAQYSAPDDQALRSAGSRADDSKAVQDLLVLAATAASGLRGDCVDDQEIDLKISRMIRGPDGMLALKAIEARDKRESAKHEWEAKQAAEGYGNPNDTIREIAKAWPKVARLICEESGWPMPPELVGNGGATP